MAVVGSTMAENHNKLRENCLHTKAYMPLHEMVKEEAGKGSLTGEVLGSAEDGGVEVEEPTQG
jgi:hypothetical protein